MQLISLILFVSALATLLCAILFVGRWHYISSRSTIGQMVREGIGQIGISAIVEHPSTSAPLLSLLEQEYPHSEIIVVAEVKPNSPFAELIGQFRLIRVNHNPHSHIRALYRSRCRAYRRVVVIDLPKEYRSEALKEARDVASFNYILRLQGECEVARNTLTYCANIIASHPIAEGISLKTIVGAEASLERTDTSQEPPTIRLVSDRILAWRKASPPLLPLVTLLPAALITAAHLLKERLLLATAAIVALVVVTLLYLSWRVMAEKDLFATTNTIIVDFYRFIVEHIKKIYYLYKESRYRPKEFLLSLRYSPKRRE